MEFLTTPSPPLPDPRNLYPCLATITVHPPGTTTSDRSRRLSTGSYGSADGEDSGGLRRVISGGRRKSSFGDVAGGGGGAGGRRLSFGPGSKKDGNVGAGMGGSAVIGEEGNGGTWYWRVQAGVVDSYLVLKPLTQPANPLLTSPPAPLSHAIPSHASHPAAGNLTEGSAPGTDDDSGLVGKMKKLFRRESTTNTNANATGTGKSEPPSSNAATTTTHTNPPPGDIQEEEVLDQAPTGEMLPSAKGNAVGATNLNANAETGWPGVINGEKLGAIVVALGGVDKSRVVLGGGKKGEGSSVTVPITSHFSHFVHPMLEAVGEGGKSDSFPKSGSIKFEFDKDWIGAKGEAELLYHYITRAISALPERAAPEPTNFQLGSHAHDGNQAPSSQRQGFNEPFATQGGNAGIGAGTHGTHGLGEPVLAPEVAPESVDSSRSGKVGGEY